MKIFEDIKEFSESIPSTGSILSIDYGKKKIGFAISSPERSMSLPLSLIENKTKIAATEYIKSIIKSKNICAIVIGMPVYLDGSESDTSKEVRKFAAIVLEHINLPIYLQDERRTSKAADSLLAIAGFNRKERNNMDDPVAASLILDSVISKLQNL